MDNSKLLKNNTIEHTLRAYAWEHQNFYGQAPATDTCFCNFTRWLEVLFRSPSPLVQVEC